MSKKPVEGIPPQQFGNDLLSEVNFVAKFILVGLLKFHVSLRSSSRVLSEMLLSITPIVIDVRMKMVQDMV